MQQLAAEGQALGLDAAEVQKLAQAAEAALQDLRDHSGWQAVRSDDLQAHYRHERGLLGFCLGLGGVSSDGGLRHALADRGGWQAEQQVHCKGTREAVGALVGLDSYETCEEGL